MKFRGLIIGAALLGASALALTICQAADDSQKAPANPKTTAVSAPADKTAPSATSQKPQPEKAVATAKSQTSAEHPKVKAVTGTNLPTAMHTHGRITDGFSDLTVIDQYQIEHSGASTVAGVLIQEPGLTIRSR